MSASQNTESLVNQGEFRSRVPPSEPLERGGHKPGVKVGNDALPEFHAEAYPPGTAPAERTFQPRPTGEPTGEFAGAQENQSYNYTNTSTAENLLPGATSADVNTGHGKPLQGQENRELHGKRANKREGAGLEGVGASVGVDVGRQKEGGRLPGGVETGSEVRGKAGAEYPSAAERVPESAEALASEFD